MGYYHGMRTLATIVWVILTACLFGWAVYQLANVLDQLRKVKEYMGANQLAVDALAAQANKAFTEIQAAITALRAEVDRISAESNVDFTDLRGRIQDLDDVVPDEIVPDPEPEPEPEPAPPVDA